MGKRKAKTPREPITERTPESALPSREAGTASPEHVRRRRFKIAITGATGTLGRALAERLIGRGDSVRVLSRDPARAEERVRGAERYLFWNGITVGPWLDALEGLDAVVHLSGSSASESGQKKLASDFQRSRVLGTRAVIEGLGGLRQKPEVFLSASSVQVYGQKPRNEQPVDERAPAATSAGARWVRAWEQASLGAREHEIRTVLLRFGTVLAPHAGILPLLVALFDRHLGGTVLPANAWRPWIHLEDAVGMMIHAIEDRRIKGALNVTAPEPVRSTDFSRLLGRQLDRASWLPIPPLLVSKVLGEPAAMLLHPARRVVPARSLELGYAFRYPELKSALAALIVARMQERTRASELSSPLTS